MKTYGRLNIYVSKGDEEAILALRKVLGTEGKKLSEFFAQAARRYVAEYKPVKFEDVQFEIKGISPLCQYRWQTGTIQHVKAGRAAGKAAKVPVGLGTVR